MILGLFQVSFQVNPASFLDLRGVMCLIPPLYPSKSGLTPSNSMNEKQSVKCGYKMAKAASSARLSVTPSVSTIILVVPVLNPPPISEPPSATLREG